MPNTNAQDSMPMTQYQMLTAQYLVPGTQYPIPNTL